MSKVTIDVNDLSLDSIAKSLDEDDKQWLKRLKGLRKAISQGRVEICTELPRHLTEYMDNKKKNKELNDPNDPPILRAGKRLKYVLEKKKAIISDNNLLAGTTTSKPIGAIVYPDLMNAMSIWPELETIYKRGYDISDEEIEELNSHVFPYWMDRTVMEKARLDNDYPDSMKRMEDIVFFACSKATTVSHTIPCFSRVVKEGLEVIREEAEASRKKTLEDPDEDREKAHFYEAVTLVIDGVLAYAKKLSKKAYQMSETESNPARKKELETMGEICARVPKGKSESFQEALNAIWICWVALHQENANIGLSLGRLDQVLYECYQKSREKGMSLEEALELVGCFWLKMADHVPVMPEAGEALFGGTGSNQAITLGGVDCGGRDAVNDLTYVMLKATELLKLRDPNVNCRYYPGVSKPEYLVRLCQVNVRTGATPCFHNDIPTIVALMTQGMDPQPVMSLEHALDYASVGCVEPTSAGRTFGHTGAALMNLTAPLEMALFQGKHRLTEEEQIGPLPIKAPESIDKFEDFMAEFYRQLGWMIGQMIELNNIFGKVHQEIHPTPLLSTLMEGCMAKGMDVTQGGALYNSSGVAVIGLAEVVDSLTAIQEFVFKKKECTLTEMIDAVKQDWAAPHDKLRLKVKASQEKFGADSEMAKENADNVMRFLHERFQDKDNEHYRGGRYTVGYWTMTYHAGFALLTGALPSGRKRGDPLPSGITPVSGSARDLSDCLDFVASLDKSTIVNGHALNMKFPPSKKPDLDVKKLACTVDTYMQKGGMQVQCNIINEDGLREAMKPENKDKNRDLLVRVSGYTAYFVDLNQAMQEEIIARAEYDLGTRAGEQIN